MADAVGPAASGLRGAVDRSVAARAKPEVPATNNSLQGCGPQQSAVEPKDRSAGVWQAAERRKKLRLSFLFPVGDVARHFTGYSTTSEAGGCARAVGVIGQGHLAALLGTHHP